MFADAKRRDTGVYVLTLLGCAGVLIADVLTPLGFEIWFLYLLMVAASLTLDRPHWPLVLAAVSTLGIVAGFFLSLPMMPAFPLWISAGNRVVGVATLWVAAYLVRSFVTIRIRERKQELTYRAFFDNLQEAVSVLEPVRNASGTVDAWRFRDVNETAARLFGLKREDVLGKVYAEVVGQDHAAQRMAAFLAVQETGEPQIMEVSLKETAFLSHMFLLSHDLVATASVDISSLKHVEAQLRVANAELENRVAERTADLMRSNAQLAEEIVEHKQTEAERQQLQEQIQYAQKLESLGVLAGGIAHDFNNILAAILGNAELALDEVSHVSRARPCLEEITKATRRAHELTRQMLAYSGKGLFEIKEVDLSEVVDELTRLLTASMTKKTDLKLRLARNMPAVRADIAQLEQLMTNMIVNASESLDQHGGGVVTVRTGVDFFSSAYLETSRLPEKVTSGRYAFFEVTDTGCGMDEATRKKLFDPFFTTKFTGRGLGMSAVLGIVRGHHGAIMVESVLGQGSTVRVLLPALDRHTEQTREISRVPANTSLLGTVLLVDDEDQVRDMTIRMLQHLGLKAITARNGLEAVDLFQQHADEIALVLLDLSMPIMDGDQTLRELLRIRRETRVILMSGYSESELEARFIGRGVSAFLPKPFDFSSLRDKVSSALAQLRTNAVPFEMVSNLDSSLTSAAS